MTHKPAHFDAASSTEGVESAFQSTKRRACPALHPPESWAGAPLPLPGDIIGGKYRIETRLGRGGMGAVYSATHMVTGKPVAVKWMLRSTNDEHVRRRFLREARTAARVYHRNVVDVYDVGEEGPCGYLVMELLYGEPLRALLRRGPLASGEAVRLLMPALRGLAAVHRARVIHRDLKPENIFLCTGEDDATPDAKLLDFGISVMTAVEPNDAHANDHTLLGTPAYMAPEQLQNVRDLDARSDVYSVGVILFEMLSGKLPFDFESYSDLVVAIVTTRPEFPAEARARIPEDLRRVVLRALAKRRDQRPASIEQLIELLTPFMHVPAPTPPASRKPSRAKRVSTWAAVAGAAALGLGGAFWYETARKPQTITVMSPLTAAEPAAPSGGLVLPATLPGQDAGWARLGLMDLVQGRLRAAGVPVLSTEAALGALRAQPDPARVGGMARAAWVASVEASQREGAWELALSAADGGKTLASARVRAADLSSAAREAADQLASALGGRPPAADSGRPSELVLRARAASLAGDDAAALALLGSAPEDEQRTPALRFELAQLELAAGHAERALEVVTALLAEPTTAQDPRWHAQLLELRADALVHVRRDADAIRAYNEAIALATNAPAAFELGRALAGRAAISGKRTGDPSAIAADLEQARGQFEHAGDALSAARADFDLGAYEDAVQNDPNRALPHLRRAAATFAALGSVLEEARARSAAAHAHRARLENADALAESGRAMAMESQLRDPALHARVLPQRAYALMEAGRLREARQLLARADVSALDVAGRAERAIAELDLLVHDGHPARAVAQADAALKAWPAAREPALRAWMQWRREVAARLAQLPVSQRPVISAGCELETNTLSVLRPQPGSNAPDNCLADQLVMAEVMRARGDLSATEESYRAAIGRADENAVPAEIARAVMVATTWFLDTGRIDDARHAFDHAERWADRAFDLSVLQARTAIARNRGSILRTALARAKALAGERALPEELSSL